MKLSKFDFSVIRNWMYRHARPLDLARWKYHFEDGSQENVLNTLSVYQNQDGGFGHALEADSWNPHSTPIQTTTAMEILREIEFDEKNHPIINGILKYLDSGADFKNGKWENTVSSNNDYPHAQWWHTDSDSMPRKEYNPTATIAGFILEYADRNSNLYLKGLTISQELSQLFLHNPHLEMHPLLCVQHMLMSIDKMKLHDQFDYDHLSRLLSQQISYLIKRDANRWNDYGCKPSMFIQSPYSPFYKANDKFLTEELNYILDTRSAEGVWDITWSWNNFIKEFAISENWWKANIVIKNMRLLLAFDSIED
ncbi:hypothetical protein NIE88_05545 [Sporolactobacillus shoreicorticis]|uniref:Prenyltransferase n=1 Tax=Sporolactobacillus shoreicorticis TaxID=1923877 RepID=A0ABW5S1F1_9BACL|nr:hypothetical protein [Sporolactobacillus shoreicorticis]MCO7125236.1 hypothetical protein [Sporolactobacillus shoreicorticis]